MRRSLAAFAASVLALAGLSACGTPDYYLVQVTGDVDQAVALTLTADGVQLYSEPKASLPFAFQVRGEKAKKSLRVQASAPDPEGSLRCEIDSVTGAEDKDVTEAVGALLVTGQIQVVCEK